MLKQKTNMEMIMLKSNTNIVFNQVNDEALHQNGI